MSQILKIFIMGFITLYAAIASAQKDPNAQVLLKAVAEKANTYKSIKVGFEYTLHNVQENITEKYNGNVLIKGNKFKMSVDETITFSDGKNRWVYLTGSNEVNISEVLNTEDLEPEERFMNNPMSLYTLYENGFKYVLSGTELMDGKTYSLVDLSPEDINKPYFKIRCYIADNKDLGALKYFQKDGTRILLKFFSLEVDKKMKDSEFVFFEKDYPGVEIIDLRE